MRKLSLGLALVFVTAMTGSAMAAATVDVVKFKDKSLVASFSTWSDGTCGQFTINSAVDLQWSSSLMKNDGVTNLQSALLVTLHYLNLCSGDDITMSGFVLDTNGTVATDLGRAHLDATVPLSSEPDPETGAFLSGNITLSIDFTATGPATTIRDRSHSRDGGVIILNNFMVSSRPATAVGTASGSVPLAAGATVLPLIGSPSLSAQIGKDGSGTMTIIHNHP